MWTTSQLGDVHFHDGESRNDCHPTGPHVLHAGSYMLVHPCWKMLLLEAPNAGMIASPLVYTCLLSLYNGSGDLIFVSSVQPLTEEMGVSHNSSIPAGVCLVPPVLGVVRDPPNVPVSSLPCEEVQSENVVDSTCISDDEGGFVDMQASNTTEDTLSEYMSG